MERTTRAREGFTLIEVIGALVIFATGILIAAGLSSGLSSLLRESTLRTEATAIGIHALDSLAALPFSELPEGEVNGGSVTANTRTYSRHWTVSSSSVRARRVEVTIRYSGTGNDIFTGSTWVVKPWPSTP